MRYWLDSIFAACAVAFLCSVVVLIARHAWPGLRRADAVTPVLLLGTPVLFLPSWQTLTASAMLACVVAGVRWRWRWLHPAGATTVTLGGALSLLAVAWLGGFAVGGDLSAPTRLIVLVFFGLLLTVLVPVLVAEYLAIEWMCRDTWTRPHRPHVAPIRRTGPRVCVHVPCYTEPPDMVIATLDSLARLDYDNFDVIVVDNNTKDSRLWRPVEQHCRELGSRFRFHHVDPLAGAKGGALNFALARTGRDTELIALVDADHQVDPHFLADVVGHFADPRLAVVQTLYDYRDWRHRRFLTACFWAYRVGFPTVMRSTNERGAAFPMGTMCVLRRSAVEQVGGWSERVVTEDSELGVRLHAAGYTSLLLEASYGKGLVPERFADFAGQRFRWVYGPVQTFKEHWRTLVPGLRPSCLSRSQQLLGLHHGIGQVRITGTFLTLPLAAAAMWSMIANDDAWPISAKAALAVAVGLAGLPALRLATCRYATGSRWRDSAAALAALTSLQFTYVLATTAGLATRTTRWRRTNKFKATSSGLTALRAVRAEFAAGCTTVTTGLAGLVIDHTGVLLLIECALMLQGARLLLAPAAVLLSERELSADASAAPVVTGVSTVGA